MGTNSHEVKIGQITKLVENHWKQVRPMFYFKFYQNQYCLLPLEGQIRAPSLSVSIFDNLGINWKSFWLSLIQETEIPTPPLILNFLIIFFINFTYILMR